MGMPLSLQWLEDSKEEHNKGVKAIGEGRFADAGRHFQKAYNLNHGNLARGKYSSLILYAKFRSNGIPHERAERMALLSQDEEKPTTEKGALEA